MLVLLAVILAALSVVDVVVMYVTSVETDVILSSGVGVGLLVRTRFEIQG